MILVYKKISVAFTQRESNARLVQWSDGSWQLMVGSEVLTVTEQSVSNSYLYSMQVGSFFVSLSCFYYSFAFCGSPCLPSFS